MKIGKWRIISSSKINKIIRLIDGIPDDREVAKELLGKYKPKEKSLFQARIIVKESRIYSEYKWRNGSWIPLDNDSYGSPYSKKEDIIERHKQKLRIKEAELSKPKFQEYTIQIK